MTDAPAKLHRFEQRGLGRAPFVCVGMIERVGPIRYPNGIEVGYAGQPMGTCDYCGMGIKCCYIIKSSDGKRFEVGCDCVEKTEDRPLVRQMKSEEQKRQIALKAAKTKAANDAQRARNGGKTDKEIAAEARAAVWAERDADRARMQAQQDESEATRLASQKYLGVIGEKLTCKVLVVARISIPSAYGPRCILKMIDEDRNALVWFTSSPNASVGDVYTMTGTVKAHDHYNGEKQTGLLRVKFSPIL